MIFFVLVLFLLVTLLLLSPLIWDKANMSMRRKTINLPDEKCKMCQIQDQVQALNFKATVLNANSEDAELLMLIMMTMMMTMIMTMTMMTMMVMMIVIMNHVVCR